MKLNIYGMSSPTLHDLLLGCTIDLHFAPNADVRAFAQSNVDALQEVLKERNQSFPADAHVKEIVKSCGDWNPWTALDTD